MAFCEPFGCKITAEKLKREKKNAHMNALRTIHMVGCDIFTVSACVTDNMAKGIHLKHSEIDKARSEVTQKHKEQLERSHRDNNNLQSKYDQKNIFSM